MRILFPGQRLVRLALLSGLMVLAGCSMFSRSDPRFKPAPLTEYPAQVSAQIAWSVPLGGGGAYGFAPTVVGDAVFAATPAGRIASVDLATGKVRWQAQDAGRLSAGAGSDGQTTAVVRTDGTVVAYDSSGQEKWATRASSEVVIPPVVGDGVVVVRAGDYRIQAFDSATGQQRWSVQRPGPALALKASMQMRLLDGLVISGLPNGRLIAVDSQNGAVQWEGTVSVSQGATDLDRISDVVGAPQVQGSLLCAVTYQGRMACFDVAQGGVTAWSQRFSSSAGMATDERQAYAPSQRDVVVAFDLNGGQERWSQDVLRNRNLTAPAVVPGAVAVGDLEGYLHFLSPVDGSMMGRVHLGGGAMLSPPAATSRGIVAQTGAGNLVLVSLN